LTIENNFRQTASGNKPGTAIKVKLSPKALFDRNDMGKIGSGHGSQRPDFPAVMQ
jgi:hypothetical protein